MKRFNIVLIISFVFLSVFIWGNDGRTQPSKTIKVQPVVPIKVTYTSKDGCQIVADYYKPRSTGKYGVVIAMHQLNSNRASWRPYAEAWATQNMAVLCPDLRGHGESTKTADGKTLNWKKFTQIEFLAMDNDFEAAVKYIYDNDPKAKVSSRLVVGGASIGANLALRYAATTKLRGVFLLSPGADYHGVTTQNAAEQLDKCQLLILASESDEQSVPGCHMIIQNATEALPKRLKLIKGNAHGTDLLEQNKGLRGLIFAWLLNLV